MFLACCFRRRVWMEAGSEGRGREGGRPRARLRRVDQ